MNFLTNTLMRLRKSDLIDLLMNERERADIEFDRAERLQEEIDDMETYEVEFRQLEELKDLINNYKSAKERASLGVSHAREEESQLLDKILDFAN